MRQIQNKIPDWLEFRRIRRLWRSLLYWWQRRTRGWSDDVTWSLDVEIARFIVPRLKRFKELNNGHPGDLTPDAWDAILDKMIAAFEFRTSGDFYTTNEGWREHDKGIRLFAQWIGHLWW